jgi:hypothetical protein
MFWFDTYAIILKPDPDPCAPAFSPHVHARFDSGRNEFHRVCQQICDALA